MVPPHGAPSARRLPTGTPGPDYARKTLVLSALWQEGRTRRTSRSSGRFSCYGIPLSRQKSPRCNLFIRTAQAFVQLRRLQFARLLGLWETDPGDAKAVEEYGRALLHFFESGDLTYTICSCAVDQ